jgi:hypothetical protein
VRAGARSELRAVCSAARGRQRAPRSRPRRSKSARCPPRPQPPPTWIGPKVSPAPRTRHPSAARPLPSSQVRPEGDGGRLGKAPSGGRRDQELQDWQVRGQSPRPRPGGWALPCGHVEPKPPGKDRRKALFPSAGLARDRSHQYLMDGWMDGWKEVVFLDHYLQRPHSPCCLPVSLPRAIFTHLTAHPFTSCHCSAVLPVA